MLQRKKETRKLSLSESEPLRAHLKNTTRVKKVTKERQRERERGNGEDSIVPRYRYIEWCRIGRSHTHFGSKSDLPYYYYFCLRSAYPWSSPLSSRLAKDTVTWNLCAVQEVEPDLCRPEAHGYPAGNERIVNTYALNLCAFYRRTTSLRLPSSLISRKVPIVQSQASSQ